jgi:hypothetical protein
MFSALLPLSRNVLDIIKQELLCNEYITNLYNQVNNGLPKTHEDYRSQFLSIVNGLIEASSHLN